MKMVLGIIGSLRRSGNSEVVIKEISRQVRVPHELRLLRLPEFDLKYCNACYRCLMGPQGCVLKDDLNTILDAIAEADALIIAAPTYFLSGSACLKTFIDRGLAFYQRSDQLWGKPAVGIGVAGVEEKEGSTILDIERFLLVLMAKQKSVRMIYGALPGETMLNQENRALAKELATALFAEPQQKQVRQGLCCSYCGGETFRFYPGNKVRCMLCSESGKLLGEGGQASIEMLPSEHPFVATEQDALNHRDWLLGMLGSFKEKKKTLAGVRGEYADEVPLIKPVRE